MQQQRRYIAQADIAPIGGMRSQDIKEEYLQEDYVRQQKQALVGKIVRDRKIKAEFVRKPKAHSCQKKDYGKEQMIETNVSSCKAQNLFSLFQDSICRRRTFQDRGDRSQI